MAGNVFPQGSIEKNALDENATFFSLSSDGAVDKFLFSPKVECGALDGYFILLFNL